MTEFPNMHRRAARKRAETRPAVMIDGKPAPKPLSDGLVLAWSIAASLEGAHFRCQRRECRIAGRCCSASGVSKGALCDVPLPASADNLVIGMILFAHRLASGKR
ncbi:hypothetical protein [Mesorhizobium sp. DCY119]|jgi:hypothetical protein|uniref:hypothetical protein n=1 Tax=Mesorhizobium sp. DCY119 TaxID=2108445 RepID=UPI000E6CC91C|nr:hypothetical protein [Mesorhizobium sp. DCY119]RJG43647.1 hypothetical protein D3Y55_04805 [Mesorhizobium sp. DCY119]